MGCRAIGEEAYAKPLSIQGIGHRFESNKNYLTPAWVDPCLPIKIKTFDLQLTFEIKFLIFILNVNF